VRDEAARQKLRTDIGPVGIILYVEPFSLALFAYSDIFQHTIQ
jgi:hypothetical protein